MNNDSLSDSGLPRFSKNVFNDVERRPKVLLESGCMSEVPEQDGLLRMVTKSRRNKKIN